MKKKIFGTVLAAALIVSQAVTIFAAGSKVGGAAVAGSSTGKYQITEITSGSMDLDDSVMNAILAVNADTSSLDAVAEIAPELAGVLAGRQALTPFFDLTAMSGTGKNEAGKYEVTLSVSSLTSAASDVRLLHYSTVRKLWEVIEPSEVDYTSKLISAEFEDLSPVAVIAKVSGSAAGGEDSDSTAVSPRTGMTYTWVVWLAGAAVLAAGGIVAYRKFKNREL